MNITYTQQTIDADIARQYIDEVKKNPSSIDDIIISSIHAQNGFILSYRKLQAIIQYAHIEDIKEISPIIQKHIDEPIMKRVLFYPMFYHKDTCKVFNGIKKFQFLVEQGIDINTQLNLDLIGDLPQHDYIYHPNFMGKNLLLTSEIAEIRKLIIEHPQFNPQLEYDSYFSMTLNDIQDKLKPIIYHEKIVANGSYQFPYTLDAQDINLIKKQINLHTKSYIHNKELYSGSIYEQILKSGNNSHIDEINQNLIIQKKLKHDFEQFLYLKDYIKNGHSLGLDIVQSNNYKNSLVIDLFHNNDHPNEFLYDMAKFLIQQNNPYALASIEELKEQIHEHKIEARHLFYEAILMNKMDWIEKMIDINMIPSFTDRRHIENLIEFVVDEKKVQSSTISYLIEKHLDLDTLSKDSPIATKAFNRKLNKIGYQLYKLGFHVNEKFNDLIINLEKKELEHMIDKKNDTQSKKVKI